MKKTPKTRSHGWLLRRIAAEIGKAHMYPDEVFTAGIKLAFGAADQLGHAEEFVNAIKGMREAIDAKEDMEEVL